LFGARAISCLAAAQGKPYDVCATFLTLGEASSSPVSLPAPPVSSGQRKDRAAAR